MLRRLGSIFSYLIPRGHGVVEVDQRQTALAVLAPLALLLFLAYETWDYLAPHKPVLASDVRDIADSVVPEILEDLRAAGQSVRATALLHLANDGSDYMTNQLRQSIESHNVLDLNDRTFTERVQEALRLRPHGYGDTAEALAAGKSLGVKGILFGTVRHLDSGNNNDARIHLDLQLADVAAQRIIFQKDYIRPSAADPARATPPAVAPIPTPSSTKIWFERVLAWLIVMLLLPVFTISFIRSMLRRESNQSNAFTLGIYSAVDLLLAYLLLGASVTSWGSGILLVVLAAVAVVYNVSVMSFALRLET